MVNILFPGLSLFRCSSTQWKILKVNYLNLGWHTVCSILKNFKGKRLYDLTSLRISRFFTIIQEVTIKSSQKKGRKAMQIGLLSSTKAKPEGRKAFEAIN